MFGKWLLYPLILSVFSSVCFYRAFDLVIFFVIFEIKNIFIMKSILLYFPLFLLSVSFCLSQSASRQVIGSAGDFTNSFGATVSWTIGEPVIETFTSYDYILLQGFHGGGYAIPEYTISLSSDPAEGGIVSGGGTYEEGAEITISATPDEGYIFDTWISSGDTISQDSIHTFTITCDTSMTAHFSTEPVGLRDDWQNLSIDVFPNPAEDRLIIDFEEPTKESYTLRLISTQGEQIIREELPSRIKRETLDLSGLKSGTYIVEIFNNTKEKTFTLIKK